MRRRRTNNDDHQTNEQQSPLKKARYESTTCSERSEEELDYALFEQLPPDIVILILKHHKLLIGHEYEKLLFVQLGCDYFDCHKKMSTFYAKTSILIRLLYGYFKGMKHRQYYSLYSYVRYEKKYSHFVYETVPFIVCVKSIEYLELLDWRRCNSIKWWDNINFDHIQKLTLTSIEPSTAQDTLVSKCHNLKYLKSETLNISQFPNWNLTTLVVSNQFLCPVSLLYLYQNCTNLKKLHIPHYLNSQSFSDDCTSVLPLFPELQSLSLTIPDKSCLFSSKLKDLHVNTNSSMLNELECNRILSGNTLKKLNISNINVLPVTCFPLLASNTSLTSISVSNEIPYLQHLTKNNSIRHLTVTINSHGSSAIFTTNHTLFSQLESLEFGLLKVENDKFMKRLKTEAKNLLTLKITSAWSDKSFKRLQFLPKLQSLTIIDTTSSLIGIDVAFYLNNVRNLKSLKLSLLYITSMQLIALLTLNNLIEFEVTTSVVMYLELFEEVFDVIKDLKKLQKLVMGLVQHKHHIGLLKATKHIPYVSIDSGLCCN
jgi:hypothetical protein